MAKKDFTQVLKESEKQAGGLRSLLGELPAQHEPAQEEKPSPAPAPLPTAEPEETIVRATFIVEKELLNKIKDIAYWERLTQKDLMREAMEDLIEKYNKRIEGRK
jgi:hypothetical protein